MKTIFQLILALSILAVGFSPCGLFASNERDSHPDTNTSTTESGAAEKGATESPQFQFPLWIELRDGSILKVLVEDEPLEWLTVEQDGKLTTQEIQLSQISKLQLTVEPASAQVSRIRGLVEQLGSDTASQRESAEKQLINEGGPFVELIKIASKERLEPEFRYRIQRTLGKLSKAKTQPIDLDALVVNNKTLEGDVLDWHVKGMIGESSIQLNRDHLAAVYKENPLGDSAAQQTEVENEAVTVRRHVAAEDTFYKDQQVHVTFDQDAAGAAPSRGLKVDDFFRFQGCRLRCETDLWEVVISGFTFTSGKSRKNSIGNHYYDEEQKKHYRYQGVLEVTFCDPKHPEIPAVVDEFGCILEIVEPRHTIIEAYNTAGHRLLMVEASTNRSSFVGLKSSEPIALVRIMPNDYLNFDQMYGDDLNEDYAVDDVVFSKPTASVEINRNDKFLVVMKSGERITCDDINIIGDKIKLIDSRLGDTQLQYLMSEVKSFCGPYVKPEYKITDQTFVMLDDGSIVAAELGENVTFKNFDSDMVGLSDVLGFWNGPHALYPQLGDLTDAKVVAVYPASRIASSEFQITDGKLKMPKGSLKAIEQNSSLKEGTPDPQGFRKSEEFEAELTEVPSVWFQQPVSVDSKLGYLQLKDGQRFVLGSETGFSISVKSETELELSKGASSMVISISDVAVYKMPSE